MKGIRGCERKTRQVHAGVQAGVGSAGGVGPGHRGGAPSGSEQTLSNWAKVKREGKRTEVSGKAGVTAEQMEISRLRAELARVRMKRDILGKATARLYWTSPVLLADLRAVPDAAGERVRHSSVPGTWGRGRIWQERLRDEFQNLHAKGYPFQLPNPHGSSCTRSEEHTSELQSH